MPATVYHSLVFGARGWIGGQLCALLRARGHVVTEATARLDDSGGIGRELELVADAVDAANRAAAEAAGVDFLAEPVAAARVWNCAGRTGGPPSWTVDYLETHRDEGVRDNVVGPLLLASRGLHLSYFGTGCIYEYDDEHVVGGAGFTEDDAPNFTASFYSRGKAVTDCLLRDAYPDVLNLRVRMPISADLHARSFVTKIASYARVCSIANSMTVLPSLLPLAVELAERAAGGTYNLVNPGPLTHNEVLAVYKELIDPAFEVVNFTPEEQAKILAAGRSNNTLCTAKLEAAFPGRVERADAALRAAMEAAGAAGVAPVAKRAA